MTTPAIPLPNTTPETLPPRITATLDGHVEAECPQCHHKFWHKLGHVLKEIGIGAVELPIDVIARNQNLGGAGGD
jgi:hypothetical protein